ncbi:oxidoreductase HTATIP2-like [Hyalella azteca]|uniref:Protein HTATIP2 n=1 Tax=Hyalella azteca TaxID=294128 RepID=A0A8B7MYH9_HYAAZ|nr:oxidoreductase HTATIP2-like [Hyalella azteca]
MIFQILLSMESKTFRALVLGGTGEVGRELVKQLITHPAFTRVTVLGRRAFDEIQSDKLVFKQVDFDKLHEFEEAFTDTEVAYCCLGTTRGKAGKDGFIKVDRDYVLTSAEILKKAGCSHFHLVTSHGANKDSMFLYQKIKGEAEEGVAALNFDRVSIYRPGLLLCERRERRLLEGVAQTLAKGFDWRNRMSVPVETVAKAMVTNTLCPPERPSENNAPLKEIITHDDILRLGID